MNIELSRFRVLPGQMPLVEEWLDFLNENMDAVIKTLDGENMLVETIFSEHLDGADYLYWFSIQGTGGIDVRESQHWVDAKHLEYWRACIDASSTPVDLKPRVTMIPERIMGGFTNAAQQVTQPPG